jgi:hypothetical protein
MADLPLDDATVRAGADLYAMADLVTPMAIRVAATLRIADHLVAGARTAPALAEATGAHPGALDRLLAHLREVGVFDRDDAGALILTARGEWLLENHPGQMRGRLDIDGPLGRAELSFVQLSHSVRTGEPAFPVQFGQPFWADLAQDPDRAADYDEAMGGDVAAWAAAIVAAFDWGSLHTVVDVGGGNGSLMVELLHAAPTLQGTVFDQPGTADRARARLAAAGLSDRSDVAAGSFFDPLPPGAGGYLLTAIIHDWDDDAALAILSRCRDAAGPGGRVFVIEKIGADGMTPDTEMDLRMLAYLGGQERGLDELIALVETAGFSVATVHDAGAISILELTAP